MNVGEDYISKFDKKYFSFVQPKNFDLYNNFLHMHYNYEFNNLQMDILRKFGDGEDIYIDNLPRCAGITTILELIALVGAESNCCYNIIFYTDDRAGLRHFMVNNSLLNGA